jgi:hypothetical protein
MEFFERRTNLDDQETFKLPKKLENYKVRYQEIVPCGWCGNLNDIHSMARGEDVFTRDSWFCSPYCEMAYLTDATDGEEFFNETEGMSPEDIPWDESYKS